MNANVPFRGLTLPLQALLRHLLDTSQNSSPTQLIVCASKTDFIAQLQRSIDVSAQHAAHTAASSVHDATENASNDDAVMSDVANSDRNDPLQNDADLSPRAINSLLHGTMRQLSQSQKINLTFITSIEALLAVLATLSRSNPEDLQDAKTAGRLVLLNVVMLHRDMSSLSAQGLSRTFAAAVEAAWRTHQDLILAECHDGIQSTDEDNQGDEGDERQGRNDEQYSGAHNVWDEEIPVIDTTTKTFGVAGDVRAWMGRKVTVRRVLERWFSFEQLDV